MDPRSRAVTQEFQKQKKTKERRKSTNKSEESMATGNSLERNLKEMQPRAGFKDEISSEICELRQDFNMFWRKFEEIRGDINSIRSEAGAVKGNMQEVEQRILVLDP